MTTESTKKHQGLGCLVLIVALPLGLHLLSGPPYYSSASIEGTVIDETSGRPLSGVVVVAVWEQMNVVGAATPPLWGREAVTDTRGHYLLPAVGPHLRRPFRLITKRDPVMWFYKPGYCVNQVDNTPGMPLGYASAPHRWPAHRTSYWNHRTIPLQPAPSLQIEAGYYVMLENLATFGGSEHLDPDHYPQLWHALSIGYTRFPPELTRSLADSPGEAIKGWKDFGDAKRIH